jgi:hypothetical protein
MSHRPLHEVAAEIEQDWTALHGAAQPYINAMKESYLATSRHRLERGSDMIQGFLMNAQTWRGETARRVKTELKAILKNSLED